MRPLPDKENEDDFRNPDRRQARLHLQTLHLQKLQLLNFESAAFRQGVRPFLQLAMTHPAAAGEQPWRKAR
jgi:hypothetical protein